MARKKVLIIGNGIAGITCARTIRKLSDHEISVISSESRHFWSRTALMYIYMGHMRFEDTKPYEDDFWSKNDIGLIHDRVLRLDAQGKQLFLEQSGALPFDFLLIASGSRTAYYDWPGQELDGVTGMYSLQDLEYLESRTRGIRDAAIVGGGLIGIELAEMLRSRGKNVHFLVREPWFWGETLPGEEGRMISAHMKEHGVDLRLGTELRSVLPDGSGKVRAIQTSGGEEIPVQFVGITTGVKPNVDFLSSSGIEMRKGIVVNEFLETNFPGIFAAGDCTEMQNPPPGRKPLEPVWYTGRMQGEAAGRSIAGYPARYDPGIWFNSAKFFDIEYQTYGSVPVTPGKDESTWFWSSRDGKKALRLMYSADTRSITGISLLGIRFRHVVCETWIRERTTVENVLAHLSLADFDPEFNRDHTDEIIAAWNHTHPGLEVTRKAKRGLKGIFQFRSERIKSGSL